MTEILFRGKRKFGGTWNYGDLVHCTDNLVAVSDEQGNFVNVHPETVGQYTGLTDKHGTKIFEGDIIHGAAHWLERYVPAVVTFRNGSFGLLWYRGEVEEFNPFTSMCNVEYTVVGNIYDNPELIKGGK